MRCSTCRWYQSSSTVAQCLIARVAGETSRECIVVSHGDTPTQWYRSKNIENRDAVERTVCLRITRARHPSTPTCRKLKEQQKFERLAELQAKADAVVFTIDGGAIERVTEFCYFRHVLAENNNNTRCVLRQLQRAHARWKSVSKVLRRNGANAWTMARFYLVVVQAVLLYGSDSWTITRRNMAMLDCFHKGVARHITADHITQDEDRNWSCPDHDAVFKKCALWPMSKYIKRWRTTLWAYLKEYKGDLLDEVVGLTPPARDPNWILWWRQPWITAT